MCALSFHFLIINTIEYHVIFYWPIMNLLQYNICNVFYLFFSIWLLLFTYWFLGVPGNNYSRYLLPECGFSFHFLYSVFCWTKSLNFNKIKCINLFLFMFWAFCLSFYSVLYHSSCTVRQETEVKDVNIGKEKANSHYLQLI